MNWWRLAAMGLPALGIVVFVWFDAGPLPAAALILVGLLGIRRWILASIAVAGAHRFLDLALVMLFPAMFYRNYAELVGSYLEGRTGRGVRTTSLQHRGGPMVLCRHGAHRAYRTGDRAMRAGDPHKALDVYLRALMAHPPEIFCSRILHLRAAEAAYASGASRMAAVFGADAVAEMPDSPFLRHAVVAARGYAVCALAERDLGRTDEATRLLRLAQNIAHRNRSAERFVRLTAVIVRLSLRDATTEDKSTEVVSTEISGQSLTALTSYEIALVVLRWAQTLARRERHHLASVMYRQAIGVLEDGSNGVTLVDESASLNRHTAKVLAQAHLGLVESLPRGSGQTEEMVEQRASAALRTAADLGDPLLVARLWAALHVRYGKPEARAHGDATFECTPQFFGDDVLQARWTAVRELLARSSPGTPTSVGPAAPWPARPDLLPAFHQPCAAAVELFTTLARGTPSLGAVRDHAIRTAAVLRRGVGTTRLVVPIEALIVAHPETVEVVEVEPPRPEVEVRDSAPEPPPPPPPRPASVSSPSPVFPEWVEDADGVTNGYCTTVRRAWSQAVSLGCGHVGVEHLTIAALEDRECADAVSAAGVEPGEIRAAVEHVIGSGHGKPSGFTAGARYVLSDAATIAACSGTKLVRPWHVVLAVLAAPPSAITLALGNARPRIDEIAVRLACGATNSRQGPAEALGSATSSFGQQARIVFGNAIRLGARDELLTGEHLRTAVERYPLAPTSLRGDVELDDHHDRPGDAPRSAKLDFALRGLDVAATRWSRGVDLADLVTLADGGRPHAAEKVPSPMATSVLLAACGHARRDGQSFVGREHLARGLDDLTARDPGPPQVYSPLLKQVLEVACSMARDGEVEPAHLRAALSHGGPG